MPKEIAVGVGLVAVILAIVGPPFVALSVRPYEPPLRVGMESWEVKQAIGKWDSSIIVNRYQEPLNTVTKVQTG